MGTNEDIKADENFNAFGSGKKAGKSKNVSFVKTDEPNSAAGSLTGVTESVNVVSSEFGQQVRIASSEKKEKGKNYDQNENTAHDDSEAKQTENTSKASNDGEALLRRLRRRLVVKMKKQAEEKDSK